MIKRDKTRLVPTPLSDYQVYLFDLDGTLLDTAPDIAYAVNEVRRSEGFKPLTTERVNEAIGGGARALLRSCLPPILHSRLKEMRERFVTTYAENLCVLTRPFPDAERCLKVLGARSEVSIGLITNKPTRFAEPLLKAVGWEGLFDLTLFGDSLSSRKPSPEPLLHALEVFNRERGEAVSVSNALYIGDTEVDLASANAASIDVAIVSHGRIAEDIKVIRGARSRVIDLKDLFS